eukprot:627224-Rhodomonas_salina.1
MSEPPTSPGGTRKGKRSRGGSSGWVSHCDVPSAICMLMASLLGDQAPAISPPLFAILKACYATREQSLIVKMTEGIQIRGVGPLFGAEIHHEPDLQQDRNLHPAVGGAKPHHALWARVQLGSIPPLTLLELCDTDIRCARRLATGSSSTIARSSMAWLPGPNPSCYALAAPRPVLT